MGVLRPVIAMTQRTDNPAEHEPSNKIITLPNALTLARPILADQAARKLVQGEKGALWLVMAMAATDMEGIPARLIDKYFPNSGRGKTKLGAEGDQVADVAAILRLGEAIRRAPRISLLGKTATALALAQETRKSVWAVKAAYRYQYYTGERLSIPTIEAGKEAMAEKLVAITFAVATHETDNPMARLALGMAAMGFAIPGALRGESVMKQYNASFQQMFSVALSTP
ncbi:MAG: hypothetical protein JWS12_759 [Candidatus Saccharibacteria bacterium]|nr:hypothetical protein [Candidatus Saccharibacteria bacterium]